MNNLFSNEIKRNLTFFFRSFILLTFWPEFAEAVESADVGLEDSVLAGLLMEFVGVLALVASFLAIFKIDFRSADLSSWKLLIEL